jgi:hypothetical protein
LSCAAVTRKSSSSKKKREMVLSMNTAQTRPVAATPKQGPTHSGIKAKRKLTKPNQVRGSEAKVSSKNEEANRKSEASCS